MLGRFRSSNSMGFTICFTENRRISSEVRKEKDIPDTVDGRECEIFIPEAIGIDANKYDLKNLRQLFRFTSIM
jgi:hypothetical protein